VSVAPFPSGARYESVPRILPLFLATLPKVSFPCQLNSFFAGRASLTMRSLLLSGRKWPSVFQILTNSFLPTTHMVTSLVFHSPFSNSPFPIGPRNPLNRCVLPFSYPGFPLMNIKFPGFVAVYSPPQCTPPLHYFLL